MTRLPKYGTLMALLAPALLASTALPTLAQDTDKTIRVMHMHSDPHNRDPRLAMFTTCADRFGYEIEEIFIPYAQYEVLLPVQLASQNPPEIYGTWPGGRVQFQAENGRIVALEDNWTAIKDDIWPGIQSVATEPDGKVYSVPYSMLPTTFWYNKEVFDTHGLEIPQTWDQLMAAAETLKAADVTPFVLGTKLGWEPLFWFDYLVLRTAGPEFRSRLMAGQESFVDPKVVRAMELWADLVEREFFNDRYSSLGWREMSLEVIAGNAAMELMGPWTTGVFKDADMVATQDYGIFPFPEIDAGVPAATEGAVESYALSGGGVNAEAAAEVLTCITDVDVQTQFASDLQELAANKHVSMDVYETKESRAFVQTYFDMLDAPFHQNLELAAHPGITEVAKREFPRFLTYPDQYLSVLEKLEERRNELYSN
ncbi:MAG: extracellular solute-binding protein [Thalassovita sp.]